MRKRTTTHLRQRWHRIAIPGFAIALGLGAPAFAEKGDVTGDGSIDATDTMYIRQAVQGERSLDASQQEAADVAPVGAGTVGDGTVDAADLGVHLRALKGEDVDGDGLGIRAEREAGTPPFRRDDDLDGVWDGDVDTDGDGLANWVEQALGSGLGEPSGLGGADTTFTPSVPDPQHPPGSAPVVTFYASRPVAHAISGRLVKLRELLLADGYQVNDLTVPPPLQPVAHWQECMTIPSCFAHTLSLSNTDILVLIEPDEPISAPEAVALSLAAKINQISVLVVAEDGDEVASLVEDHWGVRFAGGQVTHDPPSCPGSAPACPPGWSTFRPGNGSLLPTHAIVAGDGPGESVSSFTAFFGGSLDVFTTTRYVPDTRFLAEYAKVLRLGPDALHRVYGVPAGAAGLAQGIALRSGRGLCPEGSERRWFVSADLEAFTAVLDGGGRARGFQVVSEGANARLVRNVFHWLDFSLEPPVPSWDLFNGPIPCDSTQRVDPHYDPVVENPAGSGQRILIDSAHHDFSPLEDHYTGFAALVEEDGYSVVNSPHAFNTDAFRDLLDGARILVIENPSHPISAAEFESVMTFVRNGGGLLLVIDHQPYPSSVADAAALLGIEFPTAIDGVGVHGVSIFPPTCAPELPGCEIGNWVSARTPLSDAEGLLVANRATTDGRDPSERVDQIRAYYGSAFRFLSSAPSIGTHRVVSQYPTHAFFVAGADRVPASGFLHLAEIEIGSGRVFVASEAGMLTAQVNGPDVEVLDENGDPVLDENGDPVTAGVGEWGINSEPGNEQLVLNVVRWLHGLYD